MSVAAPRDPATTYEVHSGMRSDSARPRRARPRLSRVSLWAARALLAAAVFSIALAVFSLRWNVGYAASNHWWRVETHPGEIYIDWCLPLRPEPGEKGTWPFRTGWSMSDLAYPDPIYSSLFWNGLLRLPYYKSAGSAPSSMLGPRDGVGSSLLFVAFAFALPGCTLLVLSRRWRARPGACRACGYALTGLAPDAPCPECGRERLATS